MDHLTKGGVRKICAAIREEICNYTAKEKISLLLIMACNFCISCEYAITKPTSHSIFIAHYSARAFPYAWLATLPLNLLVVSLYNRLFGKMNPFRICLIVIGVTIGIHTLSALYIAKIEPLSFILYIWKEIYVMLMFQQLWSVTHAITKISRAKYLYGIIFGVGSLGSVVGNMIPGFFAVKVGSESLLFMTMPIYLLFAFAYYALLQLNGWLTREKAEKEKGETTKVWQLIQVSRPLQFICFIVILMQISATIMDFQYNVFLEKIFPDQDLRTQFSSRLWGGINSVNLILQFVASFFIVQFLGLKKAHVCVPALFLTNAIGTLIYPTFSMVMYSFFVVKSFDYSIFNCIKEILYVPLKEEEKFKAKAVIDVFTYRSAKIFASLFVIGMGFFFPDSLSHTLTWGPLAIYLIWLIGIFPFLKKFQLSLDAI